MSQAKLSRKRKRQLGQFLTPLPIASAIVRRLRISPDMRVLEPSLGDGSFIFALLETLGKRLTREHLTRERLIRERLIRWANENLYGCEIDSRMMDKFTHSWKSHNLGEIPETFTLGDFFRWLPPDCNENVVLHKSAYFEQPLGFFDLIVGNPPFGGSFDPQIEDELDAIYGTRNGMKIKKETYSFFLLKCLDLLRPGGRLCFICSDTILTLSTMRGLRYHVQENCDVDIETVPGEFEETTQRMILITLVKRGRKPSHIRVMDDKVRTEAIEATPNLSWRVNGNYARYFSDRTLGDLFVASSGMTVGNNALFLRKIVNGEIEEPCEFSYAQDPITLAGEIERARLGRLSASKRRAVREQERRGETRRVVRWKSLETPLDIPIPDKDYRFYNKATSAVVYAGPQWVIFWKDNGEYVYTFKKAGKWYLHGVGGKNYFEREGITWSLIAPRMYTRWLPSGYILDSGAPCAFPRPGTSRDELLFAMGWTLTDLCTDILKNVINHTRNIQSKDFERLPYPVWVNSQARADAIEAVKGLIRNARASRRLTSGHPAVRELDKFYRYQSPQRVSRASKNVPQTRTDAVQIALAFPPPDACSTTGS